MIAQVQRVLVRGVPIIVDAAVAHLHVTVKAHIVSLLSEDGAHLLVMHPLDSSTTDTFSPCSISTICGAYSTLGSCLVDSSSLKTVQSSICGNGVKEGVFLCMIHNQDKKNVIVELQPIVKRMHAVTEPRVNSNPVKPVTIETMHAVLIVFLKQTELSVASQQVFVIKVKYVMERVRIVHRILITLMARVAS